METSRLQHSPVLRSPLRNVLQELSPNAKSPLSRVANVSEGPLKPSLNRAIKLSDFPVKPLLPSMMGEGKPREVLAAVGSAAPTARKRSFAEVDASEREGSKRVVNPTARASVEDVQEDEQVWLSLSPNAGEMLFTSLGRQPYQPRLVNGQCSPTSVREHWP